MNSFAQAGQVIAGRYRLTEPFPEQPPYPGVRAWNVVDTLLGTSLRILALDPDNPNASEVLDAARRSSLIDDPHVVRIISVGEDPAAHYVATEIPLGTPLSAYLHGVPFDPDQAQALTGEVASALNSARARGVRHLQLTPQHIRVGVLGEVFIDGLGVEAALANLRADSMSSSQADRMESRGIAVLLARLLTGDGQSKADAVLRSAAENGSLPGALRSTCTRELRGLGALSPADLVRELAPWGAVEPSEFPSASASGKSASPSAESAATKGSDRASAEAGADRGDRGGEQSVAGPATPSGTGSAQGDVDPLSDKSVKSGGMKPKWSSLGAFAEEHPEAVDPSATAIFRPEDFGDAPEGDYVSIADGPEASEDETIETAAAQDKRDKKTAESKKAPQGKKKAQGGKKKPAQGKKKASADAARQAELSETRVELPQTAVSLQATDPSESLRAANAPDPAAEAARTAAKPSGSSAADGAAFAEEGKRKADAGSGAAMRAGQSADRHAKDYAAAEANRIKGKGGSSAAKTEEASEMPPSFLPHSGNAAEAATVRMPVSSSGPAKASGRPAPAGQTASAAQEDPWLLGAQPEEPLSPANLAGEEIDRPLYNPSKVVVTLALVLILVVGAWAVFKFFSPTSVSTTKPTATKSLEPTKAPSSAKKPTESPTKKEDPDKLPQPSVSSVSLLNPYGAQMEPSTVNEQDNPSQIRYLTDRKTSTSWQSWWYGDASYNGSKEGIGLAIKLSSKAKVTSVKIESKLSGGKVEWRNSSESSPNSGDVVAEGGLKPGLTLSASESVATDTVILWFPELSKETAKKYRLDISEITVE